MIKRISSLIIALAVAGCSDIVRTKFKTLDDAKQANAFSRGWLPPLLPDGTTDITEVNDLDMNIGHGSFRFPAESIAPYLRTLGTQYSAIITNSTFVTSVTVTNVNTQWDVKLINKNGTGTYTVKHGNAAYIMTSQARSLEADFIR